MPEQGKDAEKGGPPRGRKEPGFVPQRGCSLRVAALEEQGGSPLPLPWRREEVAVLESSLYGVLCVIAIVERSLCET